MGGYSKEECLEALKSAKNQLGKSPTMREFNRLNTNPSSASTLTEKFGSWNQAKQKAGIAKNNQNNQIDPKPPNVEIPEDKEWTEMTPYQRYYYKNKDKEKQRTKKRTEKLKKWFKNYKKGLECERCDEDHFSCLDFHHTGEKEVSVTELVSRRNTSKERIKSEIEKCEVLCANCHRKEHSRDKLQ